MGSVFLADAKVAHFWGLAIIANPMGNVLLKGSIEQFCNKPSMDMLIDYLKEARDVAWPPIEGEG